MKLYLAGGFLEKDMISGYMRRLEAAGHTITCDWTKAEADAARKPCLACNGAGKTSAGFGAFFPCGMCRGTGEVLKTSDADLSAEEALRFARADLEGVEYADLVWHLVAGYKGSRGAYVETGYALGLGRRLVVSGEDWPKSIFHHLADAKFETHDEALSFILALTK